MNERIFELAKQADLIQWDSLPSSARTPDHESVVKARKFAELIVKECAEKAYAGIGPDSLDAYDRGWQNGRNSASQVIKEHFGVEE